MKKGIFAMMFATAALLTACGGGAGTGSGPVDDAIAKGEEAVKIEESVCLGKLPSLMLQKKEADKTLDAYYQDAFSKAEDREQMSKVGDDRKADKEKLQQYYAEKIKAEAKALDGKTIPMEFDKNFLSAGTVRLVYDDSKQYGECLKMVFEITPAMNFVMSSAKLLDAEGNTLQELGFWCNSNDALTSGLQEGVRHASPGDNIKMNAMANLTIVADKYEKLAKIILENADI